MLRNFATNYQNDSSDFLEKLFLSGNIFLTFDVVLNELRIESIIGFLEEKIADGKFELKIQKLQIFFFSFRVSGHTE